MTNQVGWDRAIASLDRLFSPCILASSGGTFRASSAAAVQRAEHIRKEKMNQERIEKQWSEHQGGKEERKKMALSYRSRLDPKSRELRRRGEKWPGSHTRHPSTASRRDSV
ncbi:hypothetical protein B0H17DRAFT_1128423 [Mycena rosella]|uniref:Uncharacterized protein n=1 Tax=Mycena rosella TaxID=1033263 RepID=A0AAD7DXB0_MYCRO|nr:hypothetical protein B0H17DRAFT_1128423 [Mycena rosella]